MVGPGYQDKPKIVPEEWHRRWDSSGCQERRWRSCGRQGLLPEKWVAVDLPATGRYLTADEIHALAFAAPHRKLAKTFTKNDPSP